MPAPASERGAATYRSPGGRSSCGRRSPGSGVVTASSYRPSRSEHPCWPHARLARVSHPSLGLPPVDRTAGLPPAAARVDAARERLAARALEIAIDRDPTIRDRYDELGLRRLVRDTVTLIDRVVDAMAVGDPEPARVFAEAIPPVYRRRKVPM